MFVKWELKARQIHGEESQISLALAASAVQRRNKSSGSMECEPRWLAGENNESVKFVYVPGTPETRKSRRRALATG